MQALRNTKAVVDLNASSGDAAGAVAVVVTAENGSVLSTGNAAHDTSDPLVTGHYQYTIPAQAVLTRGIVSWTGVWDGDTQTLETDFEVIGAHLFTVAEARRFHDKQLTDPDMYPWDDIVEARERITNDFGHICATSFVPRYEREWISGNGRTSAWLSHKRPLTVLSVSLDGVIFSPTDLTSVSVGYVTGRLDWPLGWTKGYSNVLVEYEYGWRTPPDAIRRAALTLAHYELINSEITDRMVSVANELGAVRLSVPGRNAPTGIPVVDAALTRYDEHDRVLVA